MAEDIEKTGQSKKEGKEDQSALMADDDINSQLLEELEPEQGVKNESNKPEDFFSQDPADLDEPDKLDLEDAGEINDHGKESKADTETGAITEDTEEDIEAVELDEPEEGPKEDSQAADAGAKEEATSGGEGKEQSHEKADSSSGKQRAPVFRNRALIGVLVVGVMLIGAGFFLGTRFYNNEDDSLANEQIPSVTNEIVNEKLAPFFILLRDNNDDALMVKIDFVVSWSRICSIRFKQARNEIRSELYSFLSDLFGKGVSTKTDKPLIKEGTTKVLNSALGVTTVRVSGMDIELI